MKIESIQWLRGIAALLIVIWHSHLSVKLFSNSYLGADGFSHFFFPLNHLDLGIDLFFVISGYIMADLATREGERDRTIGHTRRSLLFFYQRFVRIYPIYWLFTAIVIGAFFYSSSLNLGGLSENTKENTQRIATSLLLFPQEKTPVLGVGWTLIYEMMFYCLVTIGILLGMAQRLPLFLGIVAALSVIMTISDTTILYGHVFSPFFILFFAGALLRSRITQWTSLPTQKLVFGSIFSFILLGASLSIFNQSNIFRAIFSSITSIFVISTLMKCETSLKSKFPLIAATLFILGESSYSLYISHWITLSALGKMAKIWTNAPTTLIVVWHIFTVAIAIGIGIMVSRWIEIPSYRYLSKKNPFRQKSTAI